VKLSTGWVRGVCGIAVVAGLAAAPWVARAATGGQGMLLTSYLQLLIVQQIPTQARAMAAEAPQADRAQVEAAASRWAAARTARIRKGLEANLGAGARGAFQEFVAGFTSAESSKDEAYLHAISADLALRPGPRTYAELRQQLVDSVLKPDVEAGSEFLGELQTWADLRRSQPGKTPPLDAWLTRAETPSSSPSSAGASASGKARAPADPLADAEAGFSDDAAVPDSAGGNPLDTFTSLESSKREKKLLEAQAGMQQIAAERKTAEEEYASRKLAAAQAEADAMKRQAEQLASVEQQALEQRQRSWGNRLKSLVATTIGAAGGAFLGEIGSQAGQQAAQDLFQ
jgi:hypothetical protein